MKRLIFVLTLPLFLATVVFSEDTNNVQQKFNPNAKRYILPERGYDFFAFNIDAAAELINFAKSEEVLADIRKRTDTVQTSSSRNEKEQYYALVELMNIIWISTEHVMGQENPHLSKGGDLRASPVWLSCTKLRTGIEENILYMLKSRSDETRLVAIVFLRHNQNIITTRIVQYVAHLLKEEESTSQIALSTRHYLSSILLFNARDITFTDVAWDGRGSGKFPSSWAVDFLSHTNKVEELVQFWKDVRSPEGDIHMPTDLDEFCKKLGIPQKN